MASYDVTSTIYLSLMRGAHSPPPRHDMTSPPPPRGPGLASPRARALFDGTAGRPTHQIRSRATAAAAGAATSGGGGSVAFGTHTGTAGRPTFITRDAGASNAGSSEDDDEDDAEYPYKYHLNAGQEEAESDVASEYSESESNESEGEVDPRGITQWRKQEWRTQDDAGTLASQESARDTGWKAGASTRIFFTATSAILSMKPAQHRLYLTNATESAHFKN
jgi:hypothetical protein